MRTSEWLHNAVKSRLSSEATLPPLTAIETLLCERIDQLQDRLQKAERIVDNLNTRGHSE